LRRAAAAFVLVLCSCRAAAAACVTQREREPSLPVPRLRLQTAIACAQLQQRPGRKALQRCDEHRGTQRQRWRWFCAGAERRRQLERRSCEREPSLPAPRLRLGCASKLPSRAARPQREPGKKGEAKLARRLWRRLRARSLLRLAAAPHLQETPHALGATGDCLRRRSFGEGFLGCFFPSAGPLKHHL
jgi:hypothetical protein